IVKIHVELNHRGVKGTYYNLKQKYYWPGIKDQIAKVIKECSICSINNRKNTGGCDFVATRKKLEKVALDIMEVEGEKRFILLGIDYFTRKLWGKSLGSKSTEEVIRSLEEWIRNDGFPDELITDNAKEFCSEAFEKWCSENDIKHRKVGVESHRSNGRIERGIRTIREALLKQDKEEERDIKKMLSRAVKGYNNTYHSGIKCTPDEAWLEESADIMIENDIIGEYATRFKKQYRETFIKGQLVRIARKDNLGTKAKSESGRFLGLGIVVLEC
ncbi:hypothetical protein NGRA_3512, partial [Nosema granulosis]